MLQRSSTAVKRGSYIRRMNDEAAAEPGLLPPRFASWFRSRGWTPRSHQLEVLAQVRAGRSVLLVAPTGGGKTLAGFLPSLVDLASSPAPDSIHTLYLSPLKALAIDVARNLGKPVEEMALGILAHRADRDFPGRPPVPEVTGFSPVAAPAAAATRFQPRRRPPCRSAVGRAGWHLRSSCSFCRRRRRRRSPAGATATGREPVQ